MQQFFMHFPCVLLLCITVPQFLHFTVDGHLGFFLTWADTNLAAINFFSLIHLFVWLRRVGSLVAACQLLSCSSWAP